jgi:hypothetical protein
MSKTFRREPSPFADRREAFARGDKRDRFEERRVLRAHGPRAQAMAALSARDV